MIQLGNTYIPDIKAITMYNIMNEVDLKELGYIIPKQKPTSKVYVAETTKKLILNSPIFCSYFYLFEL